MPSKFQTMREFATLTIPIQQTTSSSYELGGTHLIGVLIPSALSGSKFKIQGSINGENFYDVYGSESGTAKEIKATVNTFVAIENNFDNPFNYVRLVSNMSETAERTLQIVCHP
jgi:hypothetical protein